MAGRVHEAVQLACSMGAELVGRGRGLVVGAVERNPSGDRLEVVEEEGDSSPQGRPAGIQDHLLASAGIQDHLLASEQQRRHSAAVEEELLVELSAGKILLWGEGSRTVVVLLLLLLVVVAAGKVLLWGGILRTA